MNMEMVKKNTQSKWLEPPTPLYVFRVWTKPFIRCHFQTCPNVRDEVKKCEVLIYSPEKKPNIRIQWRSIFCAAAYQDIFSKSNQNPNIICFIHNSIFFIEILDAIEHLLGKVTDQNIYYY